MMRTGMALLVATMFVSCSSAPKTGKANAPTEREVIDILWRYHIGVVRSTQASEFSLNGDEFARSIVFLETATGIHSDTPNWAGRIPTHELPNTINRWEEWYKIHDGELRLSRDGCGVIAKSWSDR